MLADVDDLAPRYLACRAHVMTNWHVSLAAGRTASITSTATPATAGLIIAATAGPKDLRMGFIVDRPFRGIILHHLCPCVTILDILADVDDRAPRNGKTTQAALPVSNTSVDTITAGAALRPDVLMDISLANRRFHRYLPRLLIATGSGAGSAVAVATGITSASWARSPLLAMDTVS